MHHRYYGPQAAGLYAATLAVMFCSTQALALTKPKPKANAKPAVIVEVAVFDSANKQIPRSMPMQPPGVMTLERDYQQGDYIRVTGPKAMVVKLNDNMPECMVWSPNGIVKYTVPNTHERRVYPPDTFGNPKHVIIASPAVETQLKTYRNLALNPYDVRGGTTFYPHATSNSECRNDPDFAARNAIDGFTRNTGHGAWPVQSWGPDQRTDLWWKLEFGRPVEVDKLVLYIRADFPHDKHWKTATIEFSDGSHEPISIQKTADPQIFRFKKRTASWLQLTNLVQDEPMGWCALTEVEAWGRDISASKK